jgi:hypothetical protein
MLPGEITRSVWRRVDIEQALAAYVYSTTAAGGAVDVVAVKALCLAFGIDIGDVGRRVRALDEADDWLPVGCPPGHEHRVFRVVGSND